MLSFLIGLLGGGIELFLLGRLVAAVQAGNSRRVVLYALLKILVLTTAFAPVILFLRDSLLWCAVGMPVSLIAGAFLCFFMSSDQGKQQAEGDEA